MAQTICAGCLEPIPKSGTDSKFVLSGTEVFHSRCAHLIGRSVLTRYRVRINELKSKLASTAADAAEVARLRTCYSDLERDYNRVYGEKQRLDQEVTNALNSNLRAAQSEGAWRAREATLTRERDDAQRELAEAKAELARIRGTPNEGSTKDANFLDDFSIRAGLLEID